MPRKHRPNFYDIIPCPKCGFECHNDGYPEEHPEQNVVVLVKYKKGLCPKCGWLNNSVARRGYAPNEGSTNDSTTKQVRHHKKRLLKKATKNASNLT